MGIKEIIKEKINLENIVVVKMGSTREYETAKRISPQGYDYAHTRVGKVRDIDERGIIISSTGFMNDFKVEYYRIQEIRKVKSMSDNLLG